MSNSALESAVVSPYRGVLPFRYADRTFFFGREKVVEDLYAKILLYRLVLLFGESGAGKSSVINAGIIPALQKEGCQAERLRVSPEYENAPILVERIEGDPGTPATFLPSIFLGDQLGTAGALERIPYTVDEFFNTIRSLPHSTIPLLIFDQFEELFTLFSSKGEEKDRIRALAQDQILETIYKLAHDQKLEIKILIIIREDFLGKLEIFSRKYPQIFDHRVRLGHLDTTAAKRAIVGPFKEGGTFSTKMADGLADTIAEELAQREGQGMVHATQLQIVCNRLWQKYSLTSREITEKEFVAAGRVKGLLEGYLTSELEKLETGHRPQAIRILTNLITDSDTRDIVSEDKLRNLLASQGNERLETFAATLRILEERRIINRTTQRDNFYYEVTSEYLINPIKLEKRRLGDDHTRRRQRNLWLKVLAGVIIVLSTPTYWAYTIWKESWPWASLANLSSGKVNELRGEVIYLGRPTEETRNLRNQILVDPKDKSAMQLIDVSNGEPTISRVHLLLFSNFFAMDMRSLNGTTVNAKFLPYGKIQHIKDGDIIALAGLVPFQLLSSPKQMSRPSSAWAMVIDGKARNYHYLTGDSYALALNGDGSITVKEMDAAGGLLMIEKTDRGATIMDVNDNIDLRTEMRVGDYTYFSCKIPPGKRLDYLDIRELDRYSQCEELMGRRDLNDKTRLQHSLSTVTYKYGDTPFQIVPVGSDLEASAPTS